MPLDEPTRQSDPPLPMSVPPEAGVPRSSHSNLPPHLGSENASSAQDASTTAEKASAPSTRKFLDKLKEEALKKVAWLVVGVITAAVVAVVGISDPNEIVQRARLHFTSSASGNTFTVMVADLDGTDGSTQAQQIYEVLGQTAGITAYRYRQVLRLSGNGSS